MKTLVIIDAQNDFITGPLGSKEAQEVLPKIINYVKNFDGNIFYTMDQHYEDDKNKELEAFGLHCVHNTEGCKIPQQLQIELDKKDGRCFYKDSFMILGKYQEEFTDALYALDAGMSEDNTIYICGYCTDICVLNNALRLRSTSPQDKIIVLKDLCCGTSPEMHQKALDIMKVNLIEVQESK